MLSIKKKLQRGFTLVELMIVVAIIGILAVLAIYGVKKYIANAKTAEARQALGRMGKDAAAAYEGERMNPAIVGDGVTADNVRALCASEPGTVPGAVPMAQKYQSQPADWKVGAATAGVAAFGFACLRFELNTPQYYAYGYQAPTLATMQAKALGDLDGNGTQSQFLLKGEITQQRLKLAPQLEETNPEE